MSETKHTPGPWRYWPCKDGSFKPLHDYMQIASGTDEVARVIISSTTEADMRLIAAAPDLLDALQEMIEAYGELDTPERHCQKIARAAIAKATGEST